MGLAKRIIPAILHKNGQMVKGEKFVNDRVIGNALQAARIHSMRGVDELILLDITATQEGREPNYELAKALTSQCTIPVTVGGGIKTSEHVKQLLRSGADKVCIHSAWLDNLWSVERLSKKYGSQCITLSLDYTDATTILPEIAWSMEHSGAGEILLQHKHRDGTMNGYAIKKIKQVCERVGIPVIASSGCSGYKDMYQAIQAGADAVAAGALFAFTDATPRGAAEYLHSKGVEVRL